VTEDKGEVIQLLASRFNFFGMDAIKPRKLDSDRIFKLVLAASNAITRTMNIDLMVVNWNQDIDPNHEDSNQFYDFALERFVPAPKAETGTKLKVKRGSALDLTRTRIREIQADSQRIKEEMKAELNEAEAGTEDVFPELGKLTKALNANCRAIKAAIKDSEG
jgi:hypothetical protein